MMLRAVTAHNGISKYIVLQASGPPTISNYNVSFDLPIYYQFGGKMIVIDKSSNKFAQLRNI